MLSHDGKNQIEEEMIGRIQGNTEKASKVVARAKWVCKDAAPRY